MEYSGRPAARERSRTRVAGAWLWASLGFLPLAAGPTPAVRQYVPVTVRSASDLGSRVGLRVDPAG